MIGIRTGAVGAVAAAAFIVSSIGVGEASAQGAGQANVLRPGDARVPTPGSTPTLGASLPPGYIIGPDDLLSIVFWRDRDLSSEAVVRPDGRISLPLLNDVQAAGLTPEQLKERLETEARRYVEDPTATVIVRQINSRRVFVTGQVARSGSYPLTTPTTVLQLIAMAGGIQEYADEQGILILRPEGGRFQSFRFNYKDVSKGKKLQQNIELKPGDTVIVP